MNVVRPFAATSRERAHGADREPQLRGETLVRICSLEKTYQSKDGSSIHALANINLEIRAAEFVSVVGPSGCGKTTLLKILAGILDRTSGEVEMAGSRLCGPSREVGVVFQSPVLLPWRTVLQNVMVPVEVQRRDRTAFGARARARGHGRPFRLRIQISGGAFRRYAATGRTLSRPGSQSVIPIDG
jgi:ABC-type nitrate/sulfonate/bicarbonate transport system ATPase subunit